MCVLTFVPHLKTGFTVTNNRDENALRPKAILPKKYLVANKPVYYPMDPKAGGTWIATNLKYTLCLLNGAYEKHITEGKYPKSRGEVILEFFKHQNLDVFKIKNYFVGFENFTLVIIETNSQKISEIVWDGTIANIKPLDWNKPYIWSSCTLYSNEIIKKRKQLFEKFLHENSSPNQQQLFDFHKYTEVGHEANNLVMKRDDGTVTQSICQIDNFGTGSRFIYSDLLANKEKSLLII